MGICAILLTSWFIFAAVKVEANTNYPTTTTYPHWEEPVNAEPCCQKKTVGPYDYTLIGEGDVPSHCLSRCLYNRDDEDDPKTKYCFAKGHLEVNCTEPAVGTGGGTGGTGGFGSVQDGTCYNYDFPFNLKNITSNLMTPSFCQDFCGGFRVSAVGSVPNKTLGGTCFCQGQLPSSTTKVPESLCGMPCPGNSNLNGCGGRPGYTSVIALGGKSNCYLSSKLKSDGGYTKQYKGKANSVKYCITQCISAKKSFSATFKGDECYCGDQAPLPTWHTANLSDCSEDCPNNRQLKCGGPDEMNVVPTKA